MTETAPAVDQLLDSADEYVRRARELEADVARLSREVLTIALAGMCLALAVAITVWRLR